MTVVGDKIDDGHHSAPVWVILLFLLYTQNITTKDCLQGT
jgi:hypothetical protein